MSLFKFSDLRDDQQRVIVARIRKTLQAAMGNAPVSDEMVEGMAAQWQGGLSDVPGVHLTLVLLDGTKVQTTLARSPRSLDACLVWHDADSVRPVLPEDVRDVVDLNGETVLTSVKGIPTPVVDVRATVEASSLPWTLHTTEGTRTVDNMGRGRPSALALAEAAGIDVGTLEGVSRGADTYEIVWTPKMRKVEEIEE